MSFARLINKMNFFYESLLSSVRVRANFCKQFLVEHCFAMECLRQVLTTARKLLS